MKLNVLVFILLSMITSGKLHAQWTQTNGPEGGVVNCFAWINGEIWLGSQTGIYTSGNDGLSWDKSTFLDNTHIMEILVAGDTIVIQFGVSEPVLFAQSGYYSVTSIDGGISWGQEHLIFTQSNVYLSPIQFCQSSLVCYTDYNVYVSSDLGVTWDTIIYPPNMYIREVIVDKYRIVVDSYTYSTYINHVFVSSDLGLTWEDKGNWGSIRGWFLEDTLLLYTVLTISGGQAHYAILRSSDAGTSFDTVFQTPAGTSVRSFFRMGDSIFTTADNGPVLLSIDNGLTWQPGIYPVDYFPNSIRLNSGDLVYSADFRLFRYIKPINLSIQSQTGFKNCHVNSLRNCNNVLFSSSTRTLHRSSDAGLSWTEICNVPNSVMNIKDIDNTHDTICWVNHSNFGISFNNGLNWNILPVPGSAVYQDYSSLEIVGNRVYISLDDFWYSDDWGASWDSLPELPQGSLPNTNTNYDIGYLEFHKNKLFAVTNDGYIYSYNSTLGQWDKLFYFWSTGAHNYNYLYNFDSVLLVSGRTFAYSTNGGASWITPANSGLPMSSGASVIYPKDIVNYNGMWIATCYSAGIFYTIDSGNQWFPWPGGDITDFATTLTILNQVIYAGTFRSSVWRRAGSLNTMSGKVYIDDNQNLQFDPGERGMEGFVLSGKPGNWWCSTDTAGDYEFICDQIGDTIQPRFSYSCIQLIPGYRIFSGQANNQDFSVILTPGIQDLQLDVTNVNIFRPGFTTSIVIHATNIGTKKQAPVVKLVLDSDLQFLSSVPAPVSIIGDTIFWQLDSLEFLEYRNILLDVLTSNLINPNHWLSTIGYINPISGDTTPYNNVYTLREQTQASMDPNDKSCIQGITFSPDSVLHGRELEYVIRFQNLGNISTAFIQVFDTLSPNLDWSTFRVVSYSHPVHWSLSGQGVIIFEFNPLILPPAMVDSLGSMGYIKYAIKCKQDIQLGAVVTNTAYIYFDFNLPVVTNTTTTLISENILTPIGDPFGSNHNTTISIYPNPATSFLIIDISGEMKAPMFVVIHDFSGRQVLKSPVEQAKTQLSLVELPDGFYIGCLLDQEGRTQGIFKLIVSKN